MLIETLASALELYDVSRRQMNTESQYLHKQMLAAQSSIEFAFVVFQIRRMKGKLPKKLQDASRTIADVLEALTPEDYLKPGHSPQRFVRTLYDRLIDSMVNAFRWHGPDPRARENYPDEAIFSAIAAIFSSLRVAELADRSFRSTPKALQRRWQRYQQ